MRVKDRERKDALLVDFEHRTGEKEVETLVDGVEDVGVGRDGDATTL
jgi:hypothetical protein